MRNHLAALLALALAPLAATARAQTPFVLPGGPPLKAGDRAPALAVSWWARGRPVAAFDSGKTYVVAFLDPGESLPDAEGAVGRGNLLEAMGPSPETASKGLELLSATARSHPDVTVLGICDPAMVPIDYTEPDVAGLAAWMGEAASGVSLGAGSGGSSAWLKGTNLMPYAFVVRDGSVLWAGGGFSIAEALDGLVGIPRASKAARERSRAGAEAVLAATRLYGADAANAGAAALAKAEGDFPEVAASAGYHGLRLLLRQEDAAAWEALARTLASSGRPGDRAGLLRFTMTTWQIRPVADRTRKAMAIALETGGDDYATQRTAALFCRHQGDAAGERRAVERTLALLGTLSPADAERERSWLTRRRAALATG